MSDTVVDSSVVVKWFLPEADSAQAGRVFTEVQSRGGRLIILDLVLAEVTNAIWKRCHRGLLTLDKARALLRDLEATPLHSEPAARLLAPALEISLQYDRAIYDALFVALAQDLGLTGVTADEPLYNAVHAAFPRIMLLRDW
jgi:predicted nucleic acid-binding protein